MTTNVPAKRLGKPKDQGYLDIMAILLFSNGYRPDATKITADSPLVPSLPLNPRALC